MLTHSVTASHDDFVCVCVRVLNFVAFIYFGCKRVQGADQRNELYI